jgi:hypothetical protein
MAQPPVLCQGWYTSCWVIILLSIIALLSRIAALSHKELLHTLGIIAHIFKIHPFPIWNYCTHLQHSPASNWILEFSQFTFLTQVQTARSMIVMLSFSNCHGHVNRTSPTQKYTYHLPIVTLHHITHFKVEHGYGFTVAGIKDKCVTK